MAKKQTKKQTPKIVSQSVASLQISQERKGKFSVRLKLALFLGLISFIVYANTLKNNYTFDDSSLISENSIVKKGISAIPEILSTPYRRGHYITSNDLYRPLSLVMFAGEYQLFGLNPAPGHFINIILFASCVIMLFFFLDKLFEEKRTLLAFIASVLFALHPIHTEVVANIKSRDELLCFFFAFLSLNVFIKYIQTGKRMQLLIGSFCFFLSLLSKETVITFLAVIPLIFFFYRNENKKRSANITICAVVIAIIYLLIRFSVLNYYHANDIANMSIFDNALAKPGLAVELRIATAILILGYYIKLLFVPYPLICDYSYNAIPYAHFSNPGVLISLAIYICMLLFSIKLFFKNHKDPYAFGMLFFLITISLFSNIPFLIGTTMGERLVFFPSLGFCLLFGLFIEKLSRRIAAEKNLSILGNNSFLILLIPVSLIYAAITFNRNNEWLDNYTLYKSDVKKVPDDSRLNLLIGEEIQKNLADNEKDTTKRKVLIEEAINYVGKSIEVYPDNEASHLEIGFLFQKMKENDSAETHYLIAIKLNPSNSKAINNLGRIYLARKKYLQAIVLFKKSIALDSDYSTAYANLGLCYGIMGKFDSAFSFLRIAISIDPNYNISYENLSMIYNAMGKADSAIKYQSIAQKNNPGFKL